MALPKYQKAQAAAKAESSSKKRERAGAAKPEPAAKSEPAKKRGKIAERQAAAEKRASIAAAIEEATLLPQAVREALCSSLQGCCSSVGPFHPFQEKMLRMVNTALNDIEMESVSKRQKVMSNLEEAKQELTHREKEQTTAEEAVESAKSLVQSSEKTLNESLSELRACEELLPKAQEELGRRDTVIGEKVMEIEQAQEALAKMGEEDRCEDVVRSMLRDLSFPLDRLDDWSQVQTELSERITMLRDVVSQAGKTRKELVAKLKSCQATIDLACEKQQAMEASVKEAQSEYQKCVAALKEATGQFSQQKKMTSQTVKAYRVAHDSVSRLQRGPLAAFQEIARDIEQRHEVSFLVVNTVAASELQPEASEVNDVETTDESKTVTPVIDRSKRDAVLRRRSAALPLSCFSRKSLMERRASIARVSTISHESKKSFKSCGSESDAGDATMECSTGNTDIVKVRTDECITIEGPTDIPTPHRNSMGARA